MRLLDDRVERRDVHLGQRQPGERQREDLTKAPSRQEMHTGGSGLGLGENGTPAVLSGSGHSRLEQPGADALAPLDRMDLEFQFGQVFLSGTSEQAEVSRADGDGVRVGRQPSQTVAGRAAIGVSQWGEANRQGVSVVSGWR